MFYCVKGNFGPAAAVTYLGRCRCRRRRSDRSGRSGPQWYPCPATYHRIPVSVSTQRCRTGCAVPVVLSARGPWQTWRRRVPCAEEPHRTVPVVRRARAPRKIWQWRVPGAVGPGHAVTIVLRTRSPWQVWQQHVPGAAGPDAHHWSSSAPGPLG